METAIERPINLDEDELAYDHCMLGIRPASRMHGKAARQHSHAAGAEVAADREHSPLRVGT